MLQIVNAYYDVRDIYLLLSQGCVAGGDQGGECPALPVEAPTTMTPGGSPMMLPRPVDRPTTCLSLGGTWTSRGRSLAISAVAPQWVALRTAEEAIAARLSTLSLSLHSPYRRQRQVGRSCVNAMREYDQTSMWVEGATSGRSCLYKEPYRESPFRNCQAKQAHVVGKQL